MIGLFCAFICFILFLVVELFILFFNYIGIRLEVMNGINNNNKLTKSELLDKEIKFVNELKTMVRGNKLID